MEGVRGIGETRRGSYPTRLPRERGGATLKFIAVLAVCAAIIYAGVQYVPPAYRARAFESFMQDTVNDAALTDKNPAWVEEQLRKGFEEHGVPDDAEVKVTVSDARMEATVQYTESLSFIVTDHEYGFDRTVRSATAVTGAK